MMQLKINPQSQLYTLLVTLLLTLYTVLSLSVMDYLLLHTIAGYQPVDSLWLGGIIFFIAFQVFLNLFRVNHWKNYLLYYIGGLAIFFPLVLLASILRISLSLSESAFTIYTQTYCADLDYNKLVQQTEICGQAFAFIVYSMTVRCLPTVVTIPLLYRWLSINLPNALAPQKQV